MGFENRQHHGQPVRIPADDGAPRRAERGRRHQRLQFHQHRTCALEAGEYRGARTAEVARRQEQFGRIGHLSQAEPGHLKDADFVGGTETVLHRAQDAELLRAFAFERQHGVDHVLDHAGTGDLAVLGDVADQNQRGAGFLGEANQRLCRCAHLRHGARRGFHGVGPHGLDRVDHHEARHRAFGQGGDDVLDRGFRRKLHRRVGKPEAFGAQPHLRDRFLAGNIDRAMARAGEQAGRLRQQRRFADAGVAADQQHRAAHEPAAGDAIELGHAGRKARRVLCFACQRFQREQPALALGADADRHRRRAG